MGTLCTGEPRVKRSRCSIAGTGGGVVGWVVGTRYVDATTFGKYPKREGEGCFAAELPVEERCVVLRIFAVCLAVIGIGLPHLTVAQVSDEPQSENSIFEDEIPQVPDNKKGAASQSALAQMRSNLSQAFKHLAEAQGGKNGKPDIIRLNCVNEKLTQLKALLNIAEAADFALQQALVEERPEEATHEFEKIILAKTKSDDLIAQSSSCVGQAAVYSGDTKVETVIEEDVVSDESVVEIFDEIPIVEPPSASPFQ